MDVVLPKAGLTIVEAEVGDWRHQVGDLVRQGEILVEVLADKVDLEVEAPIDGVLTEIRAVTGEVVAVGSVLAVMGTDDTAKPAPSIEPVSSLPVDRSEAVVPPPSGAIRAQGSGDRRRPASSPRARRAAAEQRVPLESLVGTGPGGRIVERDVHAAAASTTATDHPAPGAKPGDESPNPWSAGDSASSDIVMTVVPPASWGGLSGDQRTAAWAWILVAAARRSGLLTPAPGDLSVIVRAGTHLDRDTVISGADDLSVAGILRHLSVVATPGVRQCQLEITDASGASASIRSLSSGLAMLSVTIAATERRWDFDVAAPEPVLKVVSVVPIRATLRGAWNPRLFEMVDVVAAYVTAHGDRIAQELEATANRSGQS